jgi:hypothetical protein
MNCQIPSLIRKSDKITFTCSKYAEESTGRRLLTLLSLPNPRLRGRPPGAQTRFYGDVRVDKVSSYLHHLRNQLKKLNLQLRTSLKDTVLKTEPLKWQLNLKLRWSLKDPILKMEIPLRRAYNIAWEDRNTLARSLWEITMS